MIEFVLIRRAYESTQVLGNLALFDDLKPIFYCRTIELAWLDNKNDISCVPTGKYTMVWEHSPKFNRNLWELKNVPGRSEIKFHVANFARNLNGCIGVGDLHTDLDQNGTRDLRNSANTLQKIHQLTQGQTKATLWIYGDGRDTI
jgi:hypothetical protein